MELIDGKKIAERIKDEIVQEILKLGARPNLAIILVGERDDSKLYVKLKEKQAKEVGIDTHLYQCAADIAMSELISMIDFLNADESVDGILVQLPLPDGLDADKVVERIRPDKDVDGFHPYNLDKMLATCGYEIEPPLIGVIGEVLKEADCEVRGKLAVAAVNSEILGRAIKHFFECAGARVELLYNGETASNKWLKQADVLVTALGRPAAISGEMLKDGATVIDIGISRLPDGRVVGDVDAESTKGLSGFLTPVPGGVGPITIAMAFKNTLRLFKEKK